MPERTPPVRAARPLGLVARPDPEVDPEGDSEGGPDPVDETRRTAAAATGSAEASDKPVRWLRVVD